MIQIRKYCAGEEKELWELFFYTIRNINIQDYTQAQVEAWAPEPFDEETWSSRIKGMNPFVAACDNTIVGYADVQDDGYIDHFFCHQNWQGQGVGSSLMRKIHETAIERNIERLYTQSSITAKPFFEKKGFRVIQAQKVNTRGELLTNFQMEKSLKEEGATRGQERGVIH